jgi:hypothetical protein
MSTDEIHTTTLIGPGALDRLIREHLSAIGLRAVAIHREPAAPCTYTVDVEPAPVDTPAAEQTETLEQVRIMLIGAFEGDPDNAHRAQAALENDGIVALANIVRVFVRNRGVIIQRTIRERDDARREVDALTRTVLDLERRESCIREALGAHYDPAAGESPFGQITGVIAKLERERDDALAKLEGQRAHTERLQRSVNIACDLLAEARGIAEDTGHAKLVSAVDAWRCGDLDAAERLVALFENPGGEEE